MTKRVVLLGAGHAHLFTLKRAGEFARRGYDLVAVAPEAFWYSGLATGVLGGAYSPELDQVNIAALLGGKGRFILDTVVGVDIPARTVHLAESPPLQYDALSLNLGSVTPEIPGVPCGYAVKPIHQLWDLRVDLEARFCSAPGTSVRVVVAGGGVTASELAANIAHLAVSKGGRVDLAVLVAGDAALTQLPPKAAQKVVTALERRGVVFCTNSRVERVENGSAVLESGGAVHFDVFVNATGLRPAPLIRETGLPVDTAGALLVDSHLRSIAEPTVHGGGDCIAFTGRELPKVGVYAIRQAPILFHNLLATLDGTDPKQFRPQKHFLWIMNLGDGTGLAVRRGLWWHGRAAFRLKDWIDRRFLREYQTL